MRAATRLGFKRLRLFSRLVVPGGALALVIACSTERKPESEATPASPMPGTPGAPGTTGSPSDTPGAPDTPPVGAPTTPSTPATMVNDDYTSAELPALKLPDDLAVPAAGLFTDPRSMLPSPPAAAVSQGCSSVAAIRLARQRATLGEGRQLSVGLIGPDHRALSSEAYAECISVIGGDGGEPSNAKQAAPASNALTLLLVRPGESAAENDTLKALARRFFLSRPQGERVAVYRWGSAVEQISPFTSYYDSFADSLERGLDEGPEASPLAASSALEQAQQAIGTVMDNSFHWSRNVVVVANAQPAADIPASLSTTSNVIWLADGSSDQALTFDVTALGLETALGSASAAINEFRNHGLLNLGLCTAPEKTDVMVRADASNASVTTALKRAFPEEQVGACDAAAAAGFNAHEPRVIELSLSGEAATLHEMLIRPENRTEGKIAETKSHDLAVSAKLSPEHAESQGMMHLRGTSSLKQCNSNRLSYALNLEGGRQRFLVPEAAGGRGSDKFTLIAMCLDDMYLNQATLNRLIQDIDGFMPAQRLVELRLQGKTQGVYLLLENMAESSRRSNAGVTSVVRRSDIIKVKFPNEDTPAEQAASLNQFKAAMAALDGLEPEARLQEANKQLDMRRFFQLTAFNSLFQNGDWGDEPYFVSTDTRVSGQVRPFYHAYNWDMDDILEGRCDHPNDILEDPAGLIGCAEHPFEQALFDAERRGGKPAEKDAVYAHYADVLEQTIAHYTEASVNAAYTATARTLKAFADDPAIVAVMPDWKDKGDLKGAIDDAVDERMSAFTARKNFLNERLEAYRQE